jgi:hypothetical protein
MLLKEYREQHTKGIAGLSQQLAAQAVKMGFLVKLSHKNIQKDSDSDVLLYLNPIAAKQLYKVADKRIIIVSTAYRTLDKQYALKRNLTSLVARVGRSDHGSGKSLDIVNYYDVHDLLVDYGFTQSYPSNDPVHYDYSEVPDNRSNTVRAFQQLYNLNNNKQLLEDGDCGETTLAALGNSPIGGFKIGATPRYMMLGDSGKDIGEIQFALDKLGLYEGAHDGVYGDNTKRYVAAFQAKNNLTESGIVDAETLKLIQSSTIK